MNIPFTKKQTIVGVAVAFAVAAGAAGAAGAATSDDNDQPITGPALTEASRAALDHIGEGRVTDTEIEDEESYYEVEVTLEDGSQIDVQLDEKFNVVGTEADEDGGGKDE